MNQTLTTIRQHVSVRSFTSEKLTQDEIKTLVTTAQTASTSSYQQAYSIIGITDDEVKSKIADYAGNQSFIKRAPQLFIFVADLHRNYEVAKHLGIDLAKTVEGIDETITGAIDAALAAQNMVIAAESMGLGACYIGGVRDGIEQISTLLEIPNYAYPVFGLVIGHPKHKNDLKPRLPFEGIYTTNKYFDDESETIKKYNEATQLYYQQRSGTKSNRTWASTVMKGLYNRPRAFMKDFLNKHGLAKS